MTPQEANEYWDSLNQNLLPAPIREFTDADGDTLYNYYRRTPFGFINKHATGKGYLDLLQKIRIETGEPSDTALFDSSHLITAVEIDRLAARFATMSKGPASQE